MDKQLAQKLSPLAKDRHLLEALQEWVEQLRTQAQRELETGTSEQVLYRAQGKLSSLAAIHNLKKLVLERLNDSDDY